MPAPTSYDYLMDALKIGGIAALLSFVGLTAMVGSLTANVVGTAPAVALGVGGTAAASAYAIQYFNL